MATNGKGSLKITEEANIYKATQEVPEARLLETQAKSTPKATPKPLDMRVVVSKASDSKKYHHFWCGSWKKIKVENQLWFSSAQEAEAAGYTLAGNCTK